jgi:hypothetical protein
MNVFGKIAASVSDSVRYVNQRYAKPEIQTTLFVKICLMTLRVYLFLMIALMCYALVRQATSSPKKEGENAAPPAQAQPATTESGVPAATHAQ